jgi:hypothetical protein
MIGFKKVFGERKMAIDFLVPVHDPSSPSIFSNMSISGATSRSTNIPGKDFLSQEHLIDDISSTGGIIFVGCSTNISDWVSLPYYGKTKFPDDTRYSIDTVGETINLFPNPFTDPLTPFEQLSTLEEDEREKLLEKIKSFSLTYAKRIFDRLKDLDSASKEEYPNTKLISVESIFGFKKFLEQFAKFNFKYPDITLTPLGNIRIQWQTSKVNYLSIEFISNQESKIVLFTPDQNIVGKIIRLAVKTPIVSIFKNLDRKSVV